MRALFLLASLALGACATGNVEAPSLDTVEWEMVDPRLPVVDENAAPVPVDPALSARLATLLERAQTGARLFDVLAEGIVPQIETAGEPGSESWTQAAEQLSRLDAAREGVASAMADADALATGKIAEGAWVNPVDRDAIAETAARIATIDAAQAALIDRLTGQLAN